MSHRRRETGLRRPGADQIRPGNKNRIRKRRFSLPAPGTESAWALRFPDPMPYSEGLRLQEAAHAARLAERIPDVILALQHTPVITLGRRGRDNHLRVKPEALAARGIELHQASRGGDVTYHAPGQWVLYPILKLDRGFAGAHGYLHALEEIAIRTAADFGVHAFRRTGMNGAWTDAGKIAAIGFHLRRWVSLHGMSFNVDLDLAGFSTIVPCGLAGESVASLHTLLGSACPARNAVRDRLLQNLADVLHRDLTPYTAGPSAPDAWQEIATISGLHRRSG